MKRDLTAVVSRTRPGRLGLAAVWKLIDLFEDTVGRPREIPERRFRHSLERWAADLDRAVDQAAPVNRRVLIFAFLQRWVEMSAAIAVVLAHRGCAVDLVLHPQYWNRETRVADPLDRQIYDRLVWGPLRALRHVRIRVMTLDDLEPGELSAAGHSDIEEQSKVDVMYIRSREGVDLGGTDNALFRERLERNLACAARLEPLLTHGGYDTILIGNGLVLEGGTAYRVSRRSPARLVSFEGWERPQAIVAAQDRPWALLDIDELWAKDEPHRLDEARGTRVQQLLALRALPVDRTDAQRRYQSTALVPPSELRTQMGIPERSRVVLVCSNVFWDSVFLAMHPHLFSSMTDWLRSTVQRAASHPDTHVIVQPHPYERVHERSETAAGIIAPLGLERVSLLEPRAHNTYALMSIADIGVVYASTTGIEMAARGLPVLTGNAYHYTGKGFTFDASDREQYLRQLDAFCTAPVTLTTRQVELAQCYADLWFRHLSLDFPWTLETFRNDEALDREMPMERVLSADGQRRFGQVFDYLAGRPVPRWPEVDTSTHGT